MAPYLRSISNIQLLGFNYFNLSQFVYSANTVTFYLNVTYSVVQSFCLSVLFVHFTNLQNYVQYNASYSFGAMNSSNPQQTLGATIANSFGMLNVYGPIFDQKCVLGFLNYKLPNQNYQSLFFNMTGTPMSNITTNSSYYIEYTSMCFV
jgi:hypothetical protein